VKETRKVIVIFPAELLNHKSHPYLPVCESGLIQFGKEVECIQKVCPVD